MGFDVQPSVTNFLFTDLGPEAGRIHHGLQRRGIIVRPMSAPGIRTRARISIPTRAGGERLIAALEEVL
jgi:histidinol-phosphate/aromatic aminotransferase/cobyric acid decarboxylase-like protein